MGCAASKSNNKEGYIINDDMNLNDEDRQKVDNIRKNIKENLNEINDIEDDVRNELKEFNNN